MGSLISKLFIYISIAYVAIILRLIFKVTNPVKCSISPNSESIIEYAENCIEPYISSPQITLRLYTSTSQKTKLGLPSDANLIWSMENISRKQIIEANCTVPIPSVVRLSKRTLYAYLSIIEVTNDNKNQPEEIIKRFALTELKPKRISRDARNLLSTEEDHTKNVKEPNEEAGVEIQHWRFSLHPVVIRFTNIDTVLDKPYLPELFEELNIREKPLSYADKNTNDDIIYIRTYDPLVWIDDLSLRRNHIKEMSTNTSQSNPTLRITFTPASLLHYSFKKMMRVVLSYMSKVLNEDDLDEIRWWLSDDRLFRYFLSQLIAILHFLFEYLAFIDDWKFFKGRKSNKGMSVSSLGFNCFRSIVIFLYLFDQGTSWLILLSLIKDISFTAWKLIKIKYIDLKVSSYGIPRLVYNLPTTVTTDEHSTSNYDSIAFTHVSLILAPMVVGVSLHSLRYHQYTSWWSWIISSLADSMYLFGFAAMCPQLYINYKFKSVAHLPIKAFMYKMFITFIDDAFAFLVKMPIKHKLMTLRDDIIFLIFLYQWWIYPADKERVNEFGFAYNFDEKIDSLPTDINDSDVATRSEDTTESS